MCEIVGASTTRNSKGLHGVYRENFTFTLHRLRVFENRLLTRIFRPKRDEVAGGWRKLHREELHNLYSSPSINDKVKKDEMGRECSTNGDKRNVRRFFVGKARKKDTTERPAIKWENNIKMELSKIGWSCMYWIHLLLDWGLWNPLVSTVMNFRIP
jgi:hypothetical protein